MSPQSILAYLIPRWMSHQLENIVSDALVYLLESSPPVREAFHRFLQQTPCALPEVVEYKLQVSGLDASRPDIVGLNGNDWVLIIENKFSALLTANQPETYIMQLPKGRSACLLFIVPESRRSELWEEICSRHHYIDGAAPNERNCDGSFCSMKLDDENKHWLLLTSWENLFEALLRQVADTDIREDLNQLQSLCASWWQKPVDKKDYEELIDSVLVELVAKKGVSIVHYKTVRRRDLYRRYMTIKGHINWCLEYNLADPRNRLWLIKYPAKAESLPIPEDLKRLAEPSHARDKALRYRLNVVGDDVDYKSSLYHQIVAYLDKLEL